MYIEFRQSRWPQYKGISGHLYVFPDGEFGTCAVNCCVDVSLSEFKKVGSAALVVRMAILSLESGVKLLADLENSDRTVKRMYKELVILKGLLNYTGLVEYREMFVDNVVDDTDEKCSEMGVSDNRQRMQ